MRLHLERYVEISAPLAVAAQLCATQPPLDARPSGRFWLWRGDLWQLRGRRFRDDRVVWSGTAPALDGPRLAIVLQLADAGVATHARVHLTLDQPTARPHRLAALRLRGPLHRSFERGLAALCSAAARLEPAPVAPLELPAEPRALADTLRPTHPRTVAAFEQMDALGSLAAVARLDRRWRDVEAGSFRRDVYREVEALPPAAEHVDLVYAGGGLGLLHAAVMAQRFGYRVLVFDQREIGAAHREWNISDDELRALAGCGFATPAELEDVVMRRYREGVVRFRPDGSAVRRAELRLPDVLNVALDAAALLRLARRKLEDAGAVLRDRRALKTLYVAGTGAVVAEVETAHGDVERYAARLLLDGMGATSPLALRRYAGRPFAGVCPTVGTVVSGLERGDAPDHHNPALGDVLVSVADAQRGRQLIWEGFAGRGDELTVYLFYYDILRRRSKVQGPRNNDLRPSPLDLRPSTQHRSLLDLYEDYFRLLPAYKRPGPGFRHLRPVYGYIPARHTQRRQSVPPLRGVLPIGDSSAQQSPLTFTGFGSHVRNLERTTTLLDWALRRDLLAPRQLGLIGAYQANVALNWVFSRFMQPWDDPSDVNRLQNIFARVLNELGDGVAVRFFRDRMTWSDYGRIVSHTLAIYRPIVPTALRVLGPLDTARWIRDWLRFSASAALAAAGRARGDDALDAFEQQLEGVRPTLALRCKALRAEWRAMGWDGGSSVQFQHGNSARPDGYRQP